MIGHGQEARDPGPAKSRSRPGGDGELVGVSRSTVQRIEAEAAVASFDTDAERGRRQIGRPSKAEAFCSFLVGELMAQPDGLAVELLDRARRQGYAGGKNALYQLVKELRPERPRPIVRFEGLPGEFSQHDFGQVDVRFVDGRVARRHFFGVAPEVLTLGAGEPRRQRASGGVGARHGRPLRRWGGVPLLSVFEGAG
jgi:hypothetical protein